MENTPWLAFLNGSLPCILTYLKVLKTTGNAYNFFLTNRNSMSDENKRSTYGYLSDNILIYSYD